AVGVCGSDVHYYKTGRIGSAVVKYPFVMGHECAGTVEKTGLEVRGLRPGQRVAIDPLVACGHCDQCRSARPNTCRNQRFLGQPGELPGSLAEYVVLPQECCYPIPEPMTAGQAAMIEPLSIGIHAQRLAQMEAGSTIAMLGSGPIGLSVLLACRAAAECTAYMTDVIDERLKMAAELGAVWTGNAEQRDVVKAICEAEPAGVDFVFECAGEQETLKQAVELLKPGGMLVIVSIPEVDEVRFPIHTLRRKELTIKNVRRQNHCTAPAIDLLSSGRINVDLLMTHHFPLQDTAAAFEMVSNYRDGVIKAMIHVADKI
ncbi:MAG TPA: alcohol dehydrogenase catalytic domain-containing protein, partial [Terriglobia bacterium]|nr:alcohol dehydrogenase catalytic domain-containing protein [Terriglobia bacterium]